MEYNKAYLQFELNGKIIYKSPTKNIKVNKVKSQSTINKLMGAITLPVYASEGESSDSECQSIDKEDFAFAERRAIDAKFNAGSVDIYAKGLNGEEVSAEKWVEETNKALNLTELDLKSAEKVDEAERTPASIYADKVRNLPSSQRPNTVAVIVTKDGEVIYGKNSEGIYNKSIQEDLDKLGNKNDFDRQCAEVNAVSKAKNEKIDFGWCYYFCFNCKGP